MSRHPSISPGRLGIAILLCFVVFSGCTQPVIPSPGPVSTTSPPIGPTNPPTPPQVPTSRATPTGSDYLTYSNGQYGFSISYPSSWTKQENAASSVVTFTSPSGGMGDMPASMRITVEDLTANPMSLEQYKAAQLAKKKGIDGFNLIQDGPYKGNGFTGWKVAYTGNQGSLMEWVEIYAMKGMSAYTLTYTSREDKYAGYVVQMDAMFKSFQITY
ncbi:MAG: PsbP-related protein [Methanomicrobiales archaeon]